MVSCCRQVTRLRLWEQVVQDALRHRQDLLWEPGDDKKNRI